jgi:hypothetical protein
VDPADELTGLDEVKHKEKAYEYGMRKHLGRHYGKRRAGTKA